MVQEDIDDHSPNFTSMLKSLDQLFETAENESVTSGVSEIESRVANSKNRLDNLQNRTTELINACSDLHDVFIEYGEKHKDIMDRMNWLNETTGVKVAFGIDLVKADIELQRYEVCYSLPIW